MSSPLETIREKNSRTTAKPPGQSSACPPGLFDGSDLLADGGSKLASSTPDCADAGRPVPPARAARAGRHSGPARAPRPGDSCLPPVDRQVSEDGSDSHEDQQAGGRRNPPAAAMADHQSVSLAAHADPLPGVPAAACPACGCPAVWMDGLPVVPVLPPGSSQADVDAAIAAHNALPPDERVAAAGRLLAAHLHCGGCQPPPAMSLARAWFLVVRIESENVAAAGWQSLWEEWRPKFNLAKRKTKR